MVDAFKETTSVRIFGIDVCVCADSVHFTVSAKYIFPRLTLVLHWTFYICQVTERMGDFPMGTTHIILVSSVNEDSMTADKGALGKFKNAFVGNLSRKIPSMALCSYSFGGDCSSPVMLGQ